jgi:hypothetical protein
MVIRLSVYSNYTTNHHIYEPDIALQAITFLKLLCGLNRPTTPQRAVGVKVWRLADADSTMAKSLTQSFVIKRCGMEGAAVVPNC